MFIENWVVFLICFAIAYITIIMLVISIKKKITGYKKKESDKVIEWYGPEIYLKEKCYDHIEDDFREKLIDRDNYIAQEKRRSENVRNNTSNSGANKIDGTRSSDNSSEDEN